MIGASIAVMVRLSERRLRFQERLLSKFASLGHPLISVAADAALLQVTGGRDARRMVSASERERILDRFGRKCAMCDRPEDAVDGGLALHHVAFYSEAGPSIDENLIPLCSDRCHTFAHLGLWPRRLLWDCIDQGGRPCRQGFRGLDEDGAIQLLDGAAVDVMPWQANVDQLLALWRGLSYASVRSSDRVLELGARVQWRISSILTTHGPEGWTAETTWGRIPLNRYVGLRLAQQAIRATLLAGEMRHQSLAPVVEAMTHTACAHWRGVGRFDRAVRSYRKYSPKGSPPAKRTADLPGRAYVLVGHGLDLVRPSRFRDTPAARRGRKIVDEAMVLARASGDNHTIADTALRQAESRIYSGLLEEGLRQLEAANALVSNDVPILQVIADKLRMIALARCRDWHGSVEAREAALRRSREFHLDDQARKISRIFDQLQRRAGRE